MHEAHRLALLAEHVDGHVRWAAMLPEARKRGAQSALIAARLRDGITRGCRWFVTETAEDTPEKPNPSTPNPRRLTP